MCEGCSVPVSDQRGLRFRVGALDYPKDLSKQDFLDLRRRTGSRARTPMEVMEFRCCLAWLTFRPPPGGWGESPGFRVVKGE